MIKNKDKSLEKTYYGWEINQNYFFKLTRDLENYSCLFSSIWECGKPIFTEDISTAAVSISKDTGMISFYFNLKLWDELSHYDRIFIVAHEMLHIALKHFYRFDNKKDFQLDIINMSLDIVVNHALVNNFMFNRKKLCEFLKSELCWIDTCFNDKDKIEQNKSFEYYFNILNKEKPKTNYRNLQLDFHDGLKNISEDTLKNVFERLGEQQKEIAQEEINKIKELIDNKDIKFSGNGTSCIVKQIEKKPVCKKRKWESVIKKWINNRLKNDFEYEESWPIYNKKLFNLKRNIILPYEVEREKQHKIKDKIEIWFFQDSSGSCASFADRFFSAAKSIPTGPKEKFSMRLFCFDTKVYKTDIKSNKLFGFGGTSFSAIERYIQKTIKKENIKYPDSVWIITDGMGDNVSPKYPDRWHWFIIPFGKNIVKKYIPKESSYYDLKKFE